MKKLGLLFLILIFACTSVFATESTRYLNLAASITPGSDIEGDNGTGKDPDLEYDGLDISLGYSKEALDKVGQAPANSEIFALADTDSGEAYDNVKLIPETPDETEDSVYIYVVAGSHVAGSKSVNITLSTDGWVYQTAEGTGVTPQKNIEIKFSSEVGGYKPAGGSANILYADKNGGSDSSIKVTAVSGAKAPYTYVSQTKASWALSSNYLAGNYEATIKVDITSV